MRLVVMLSVVSMLAGPTAACAQDQAPPQPPTASAAGQYQPGTLPPEPPVIEPPLPGQPDNLNAPPAPDGTQPPSQPPLAGQADNMAPPPDADSSQPPGPGGISMAPPPGPDDAPPPPPGAYGAPDAPGAYPAPPRHGDHDADKMQKFEAHFAAANTTHDGRLTLAQAQAANMRGIVKHFDEIDTRHLGYVTLNQVMAWRMDHEAQQMERRAAQLRAAQGQ